MRVKHKIISSIAMLLLCMATFAYLTMPSATMLVESNDSRDNIHEVYGKPCGTGYFKCCGIELGDKKALLSDIWEQSHPLGNYRTHVYFDKDDQAIKSEMRFQWFYEPTLYGFQRDAGSCQQYMKSTETSRQFKRVKNYIRRKTQ